MSCLSDSSASSNEAKCLPRDDEKVYRRLRIDVAECHAERVGIDGLRWDSAVNDFAEDTILVPTYFLPSPLLLVIYTNHKRAQHLSIQLARQLGGL